MSPAAVAVLLVLALLVDYLSVGPDSLRDRAAFVTPNWCARGSAAGLSRRAR
jgi:hypothetical protein